MRNLLYYRVYSVNQKVLGSSPLVNWGLSVLSWHVLTVPAWRPLGALFFSQKDMQVRSMFSI